MNYERMDQITKSDLDRWGACYREDGERYDDEYLDRTLPKTPMEISRMRSIPTEDRIWVLLRPEVLGEHFKPVVYDIVDYQVREQCLHCGIPAVEAWADRWLSGEDRTESSVWAAAWAAWGAARSTEAALWSVWAAWSATRSAADAVWAAEAAAMAAEAAADADAASDAERQRQLRIIIKHLKQMDE